MANTKSLEDSKIEGGPAFPGNDAVGKGGVYWGGMPLRDYFAAQAMAGILANESIRPFGGHFSANEEEHYVARLAYKVADAMLEARK